ncbi:MAG TPA: hypothetical protein VL358_04385 [Caulobacteraceae bacterium]|jgi:hypothetical protein|nr:hypothetical protein [Caulobacteraceae bacterium]
MQNRRLRDPAQREMERLVRLDRLAREKAEAAVVARGVAETIGLSEARGDRFTPAPRGGQSGARRRKDGLDWLYDKGRISHRQKLAGERYGDDWRKAQPRALRSFLDDTVRGYVEAAPEEARAHAGLRLSRARALAFNGNAALSEASDRVCGECLSPAQWAQGDDRLAGRLEDRIQRALELLERYYFG